MTACGYLDLQKGRSDWIQRMGSSLAGFDAVLSPTVSIVAPALADVSPGAPRDNAFFKLNNLLLRNPAAINLLDGCAVSLPCHAEDELPVGLMVWAGSMRDDTVLNIALQIEKILQK